MGSKDHPSRAGLVRERQTESCSLLMSRHPGFRRPWFPMASTVSVPQLCWSSLSLPAGSLCATPGKAVEVE